MKIPNLAKKDILNIESISTKNMPKTDKGINSLYSIIPNSLLK